jgi:hypothetical protein
MVFASVTHLVEGLSVETLLTLKVEKFSKFSSWVQGDQQNPKIEK